MIRRQVTVIGSHNDSQFLDEAYEIGRHIGVRGWTLICGGRGGIMEAASRGASDENGIVIGILPGNDFSEANPHCTAIVASGIGFARNSMNVLSGDVVVALNGRAGTLTELAYAYQYGKPIIICLFTGGWSSWFNKIMTADGGSQPVYAAHSVVEARNLLDSLLKEGDTPP
ncbi:MAG: TIGR00725 family protein [Spirochaetales bacterium]|nr:MAG: TIGR00725 family protein [Spirochaetales bacterium]